MGFLGQLGGEIAGAIQREFSPQIQGSQVPVQRTAPAPQQTSQGSLLQNTAQVTPVPPVGGAALQGTGAPVFHFNVQPAPQLQLQGGMVQGPSPQDDLQPAHPLGSVYQALNNGHAFQGTPINQVQNTAHPDILTQVRNILGY